MRPRETSPGGQPVWQSDALVAAKTAITPNVAKGCTDDLRNVYQAEARGFCAQLSGVPVILF